MSLHIADPPNRGIGVSRRSTWGRRSLLQGKENSIITAAACCLLHSRGFLHKQCWNSHRVLSRSLPAYNMALCSLCSGLPFTDFPRLSPQWKDDYAEDGEFMVYYFPNGGRLGPYSTTLPRIVGTPYHENIGALAESAKTCPMCAFVQAGVQAWLVSWNKVAGTKKVIGSHGSLGALPSEEMLWLTRLFGKDQGFCVWTRNRRIPRRNRGDSYEGLYLMMLVGFSVEERTLIQPVSSTSSTPDSCVAHGDILFSDSPLKDQFRLRPIDSDSGSSRSLDLAASWVQNCVDNHPSCSNASDVLLPSRVLDVEAEGDKIKLVDGSSISGNSGKYACLSYCVSSYSK